MSKGGIKTVADLVPDPKNARAHPERNLAVIASSLREVGAARSIVIDETDVVLAGNGVREAAAMAGITKVRVVETDGDEIIAVRRRGLTAEQKTALALYDNRAGELSEWNPDVVRSFGESGIDLSAMFTDKELRDLYGVRAVQGRTDPNEVPTPRATDIVRGDLFSLGRSRLLCGDCTSERDVARLMAASRAAICFTSPPYADQRTYGGGSDLSPAHLARFITAAEPFVDTFAVNLGIVRRDGAVVRYWDEYIAAAESSGLRLLSWNVWSREGLPMSVGQANAMFPIQHEFILVLGRAPVKLVPTVPNKSAGDVASSITDRQADGVLVRKRPVVIRQFRELGTVITLSAVKKNAEHPAQFPVELPEQYLRAFPGAVYEPFAGSGTTIIASELVGSACYAVEIEPSYCQVIIDRWEAFTGQKAKKVDAAPRLRKTRARA